MRETTELMQVYELPILLRVRERVLALLDPVRFQMVLSNLLSNALQHGSTTQSLKVNLDVEPRDGVQWARVQISDTGPGINPQFLPHLFERYAAGPASAGLGLGLYVAKEIMEAHGGTLNVDSSDTGTTFTLGVPTLST